MSCLSSLILEAREVAVEPEALVLRVDGRVREGEPRRFVLPTRGQGQVIAGFRIVEVPVGRDLPAHFRETIEEYFKRLAQDGVK